MGYADNMIQVWEFIFILIATPLMFFGFLALDEEARRRRDLNESCRMCEWEEDKEPRE